MIRKMLYETCFVAASALVIACGLLPYGHESYDPPTPLKEDGDLLFPSDYKSWNKFVPTVDRPDKEEVREIYVNDWGMKGDAATGFPHGTTFLMETFSAQRESLVLMPNGGGRKKHTVEVYIDPQPSLLRSDIPAPCRQLSSGCGWRFTVARREVDTGIHVPKGASVRLLCKDGASKWIPCATAGAFTPTAHQTPMRSPDGRLVKGKLQGLYLMQKGPNWGSTTNYETGDWLFDHYRPSTDQLCQEESRGSAAVSLRCVKNPDIKWQYEKVPHQDWSKDCRRCHTPAMQVGQNDRDYVYGYDEHFNVDKTSPVRMTDASRTSR